MPKTKSKKSELTTISLDRKTKDAANKRAGKEGHSLSTVTRILLQEYADGKLDIGVVKK